MPRDRSLPIFEIESDLRAALDSKNVRIVIEAPTGSGKSTQVPQMLLDSGKCDGDIYVLQPRRLAARMLARRVAQERDGRCGDDVGYQVRFENVVSRETRIRYVTEGILLRRLLEDPNLNGVSAVIFDEFHERHFFGDVTLARCFGIQKIRRPDLKIVAMSATLETESLVGYLGDGTQHLKSEGRMFPVEIRYSPAKERHGDQLWDHTARAIRERFREMGKIEGHTLVFMPGRHEIRKTVAALKNASWTKGIEIHELFGEASPNAQDAAVGKSSQPKIVVATNVAETSITIDGVTTVIDSGVERRSSFDARRGISTLTIEKISRASADQRAGRAGRTRAGVAIRLWSERDHEGRPPATPAEIQRMDLSEAVLVLKAGGIEDVRGFEWFEAPNPQGLNAAFSWLTILGALDPEDESLTKIGLAMSKVPLTPRFARVLIAAADAGCLEYFSIIAAATQGRPIFPKQKRRSSDLTLDDFRGPDDGSDFQALVRAWSSASSAKFNVGHCDGMGINANASREIGQMAQQFSKSVRRLSSVEHQDREPDSDEVARILLTGFSDRVALRNSTGTLACSVIGGRCGQLEKDSVASDSKGTRLFIAGEMIEIEGRNLNVKLNFATRLEESMLAEIFPDDFVDKVGAVYNETNRRVEAREERRFRDLVLESRPRGEPPLDEAAEILAREVMAGNLILKRWDQAIEQEIGRINTVAAAFPEYEIPSIGEEERLLLLIQICDGGLSYKQIKDRAVKTAIAEWLPPHQYRLLDQFAPERIELSSGRSLKIFYDPDPAVKPKISVLIQHLFKVRETPTIANGRVPLLIEILAPNSRPVQVTEDLAGFWKGSYAGVRTMLRGRYPKHDWPEPES